MPCLWTLEGLHSASGSERKDESIKVRGTQAEAKVSANRVRIAQVYAKSSQPRIPTAAPETLNPKPETLNSKP